ncbi:MAG TPA: pilin [Candidatus Bathyarchaeia archaeon]|nr:pilin [Candidatus Bathyarchaeia archaeon]
MQKQKRQIAKFGLKISSVFFSLLAGTQTAFGQWNVNNYDMTQLPRASVLQIITNIVSWLLMIIGLVAIIGFVISGILYLTAAGDEDAQKRAKRAMIYSITGVLVGLAGLVVLYAANNLLWARPI